MPLTTDDLLEKKEDIYICCHVVICVYPLSHPLSLSRVHPLTTDNVTTFGVIPYALNGMDRIQGTDNGFDNDNGCNRQMVLSPRPIAPAWIRRPSPACPGGSRALGGRISAQ